jgi:hypothetical protein
MAKSHISRLKRNMKKPGPYRYLQLRGQKRTLQYKWKSRNFREHKGFARKDTDDDLSHFS